MTIQSADMRYVQVYKLQVTRLLLLLPVLQVQIISKYDLLYLYRPKRFPIKHACLMGKTCQGDRGDKVGLHILSMIKYDV